MNSNSGSMKISILIGVCTKVIHEAFASAFSDYTEPFTMSVSQLQYQLERRGYDPALSFGAFVDGRMVGFILNGSGEWNGVPTAYDTGTGVRPDFRGQGVATKIFDASLPVLRESAIHQYLLEVIRTNSNAVNLYRKSGFTVSREFDYWTAAPGKVRLESPGLHEDICIGEIDCPDWGLYAEFRDFEPSWQNSVDSIMRKCDHMTVLEARHQGKVVAYACMEQATGDLPLLAVHPGFRRQGIATALIRRLLDMLHPPELRVTNTCSEHEPTRAFLRGLGLDQGYGQYEMIRQL
jgi:ribosomal protein S18 acetylase RimI-like enzyme